MRGTNKIDLCSRALRLMGFLPISSFSESSEGSRLANLYYEPIVDSCLSNHNWNFASKQIKLVLNPIAPLYGFKYSHALPADFLNIVDVNLSCGDYRILEGDIYSNLKALLITYIFRIEEKYFPTKFTDYVQASLVDVFLKAGMPDDSAVRNITQPNVEKAFEDAVYQDAGFESPTRPPDFSFPSVYDRGL